MKCCVRAKATAHRVITLLLVIVVASKYFLHWPFKRGLQLSALLVMIQWNLNNSSAFRIFFSPLSRYLIFTPLISRDVYQPLQPFGCLFIQYIVSFLRNTMDSGENNECGKNRIYWIIFTELQFNRSCWSKENFIYFISRIREWKYKFNRASAFINDLKLWIGKPVSILVSLGMEFRLLSTQSAQVYCLSAP